MDSTGPYVFPEPLVDEICRRNLFLRATVHVVSIGEGGSFLGPLLARATAGRFVWVAAPERRPR